MRTNRTSDPLVPLPRAVFAGVLVVAHLMSVIGYPAFRNGPAGAAAGRCSGGACGCSAESAGGPDCCCSKPTGRRTPPRKASVIEPAAGCCRKNTSCEPAAKAASECCGKPVKCQVAEPAPAPPSEPFVTWVVGWQARQCKGHGPLGLATAEPMTPPAEPEALLAPPAFAGFVPRVDFLPIPCLFTPPDPPPKPC